MEQDIRHRQEEIKDMLSQTIASAESKLNLKSDLTADELLIEN